MKTILLAGVSSKIGQALANQLLMQGHKLILVNRKTPAFSLYRALHSIKVV